MGAAVRSIVHHSLNFKISRRGDMGKRRKHLMQLIVLFSDHNSVEVSNTCIITSLVEYADHQPIVHDGNYR